MVPRLATVGGFVHPAGGAVAPSRARGCHVHRVGVAGVNENAVDISSVREAHEVPRSASVEAAEQASAAGVAVSGVSFACSNPNEVGIERAEGDRTDALGGLVVKEGFPGDTRAGALPQSA